MESDFSPDKRLFLLAGIALVIGAIGSAVAALLIFMINFFTQLFFFQRFSFSAASPADNHLGLAVIFVPVVGGLVIGLMARFGSEKIRGHGIPEALEAILFGKSIMNPKVAILKPLSSAISIGSGGPFGAEGPIIMTGGAFGSLIAQLFHLSSAERKTLLVSGAAAGMSAIFASPISAVLLAVELLLFEWKPRSLIPVAIASVVAAALRPFFLGGSGPLFPVSSVVGNLGIAGFVAAAIVGLLAGAFSALVTVTLYKFEDAFKKLPLHWMWWPMIGGLAIGVGGYFQPHVLGVGYDVIGDFLNGKFTPQSALVFIAIKSLVWVIALASGTSGGVLAPLLMMGCALGAIEAPFIPVGDASFWCLISMAAILGGMMRSPFTAIIFALELTRNVEALPYLLAASIMAYAFTVFTVKRSILTEKVARRGYDIFREYEVDPLQRMKVEEVMSIKVETVFHSLTAQKMIQDYYSTGKKHRGYPVINEQEHLVGVITMGALLEHENEKAFLSMELNELMASPAQVAHPKESCRTVAERMASLNIGRLPVVEADEPNRIVGIITRIDLLKAHLRQFEEENKFERLPMSK